MSTPLLEVRDLRTWFPVRGGVLASDAFFPKPDAIQAAAVTMVRNPPPSQNQVSTSRSKLG